MISLSVFRSGIDLLCSHFNRPLLEPVAAIWKEYLDSELNDAEFGEAIKHAILHHQFFPTAGQLVDAIKSSKEVRALQEWQVVLQASATLNPDGIAYISDRARVALQAIGGLQRIGLAENWERGQLEKNFIAVYCQVSSKDSKALPPVSSVAPSSPSEEPQGSVPMPEEVKRQMEALKAKLAMSRKK